MGSLVNGCGAKWFPAWLRKRLSCYFRAECNLHDARYAIGGSEGDRWVVDWEFFMDMLGRTTTLQWHHMPFALCMAVGFYGAVTMLGWTRFHYVSVR